MNAKSLAALLQDKRLQYPVRIPEAYLAGAKADGLVIVFGASDDLMEFRGAIHDEISCYEGGLAYLTEHGLLANDCDNDDCPHFEKLKRMAATIEAVWEAEDQKSEWAWTYKTKIPHATFEVHDHIDEYCLGIVFSLSDVKGAA